MRVYFICIAIVLSFGCASQFKPKTHHFLAESLKIYNAATVCCTQYKVYLRLPIMI